MNSYYFDRYEVKYFIPIPVVLSVLAIFAAVLLVLFILHRTGKIDISMTTPVSGIIVIGLIIFSFNNIMAKDQTQDRFLEIQQQIDEKNPGLYVNISDGSRIFDGIVEPPDYKIAQCNDRVKSPYTVGGYVLKGKERYQAEITRTLDKDNNRCEYTVKYAEHPIDYEPENKMIQTLWKGGSFYFVQ